MGYSSKQEVILALANALTSGNPNPGVGGTMPITSIGKSITDTVSDEEIQQYIRWADQNIDASLSSIYAVPLKRINLGSYDLALDVTAGDSQVILADATRFIEGDIVLIRDDVNYQQMTISTIPNDNTLTFTLPISNSYLASSTKIERIRYPDPIPKASARMAAAYLYDKHFAAQQEANKSEFGQHLRALALQDINQILSGTIRLALADANDYIGRRYYNPALDDVITTKAEPGKKFFEEQ